MRITLATLAMIAVLVSFGSAREYRSSDRIDGFRTSECKTASCYDKHPNGTWTHPLTKRKNEF